jgi:Dehydrogenases with different specificities (related to short-chain alcohol dehydrogenases)
MANESNDTRISGSSTHLSLPMDVSNTSTISTAMSTIKEKFSRPPNVLVNCAGITRDNWFLKLTEKDFQQVFDVNLKVSKSKVRTRSGLDG